MTSYLDKCPSSSFFFSRCSARRLCLLTEGLFFCNIVHCSSANKVCEQAHAAHIHSISHRLNLFNLHVHIHHVHVFLSNHRTLANACCHLFCSICLKHSSKHRCFCFYIQPRIISNSHSLSKSFTSNIWHWVSFFFIPILFFSEAHNIFSQVIFAFVYVFEYWDNESNGV